MLSGVAAFVAARADLAPNRGASRGHRPRSAHAWRGPRAGAWSEALSLDEACNGRSTASSAARPPALYGQLRGGRRQPEWRQRWVALHRRGGRVTAGAGCSLGRGPSRGQGDRALDGREHALALASAWPNDVGPVRSPRSAGNRAPSRYIGPPRRRPSCCGAQAEESCGRPVSPRERMRAVVQPESSGVRGTPPIASTRPSSRSRVGLRSWSRRGGGELPSR